MEIPGPLQAGPGIKASAAGSVMPEQSQQNDDGQRDAQKPQQSPTSETHATLLKFTAACCGMESKRRLLHARSRDHVDFLAGLTKQNGG